MLRTQIQLTDEQHRMLRAAARRDGVSISEVVRRCIARFFDQEEDRQALYARASSLVGKLNDPQAATDLSNRHDDYLDEAYG
jgi:hypothetical protein